MNIRDIRVGGVSKSWMSEPTHTQICMVDCGGKNHMTNINYTSAPIHSGNVLMMNGRMPCILGAISGDSSEPIYVNMYAEIGHIFEMIEPKYIPGTYILDGLTTNEKCQVCWKGQPVSGIIPVSLCNAQICTL
jgi:hypothetical protein